MKIDNEQLYYFLASKQINMLYHANTVATSITYFQNNGLLSRGAVESAGLFQTLQRSDAVDKVVNVWNDIFLDTTDLHKYFTRQNHYGPVLFEFKSDLILNNNFDIWITKENPIYWNVDTPVSERYFQSIEELNSLWDKISRQKKMVTIRNNSSPILFEQVNKIVVDDPRVRIPEDNNDYINLFNKAVEKIKENIPEEHILKGKFISRSCTNCFCRDNYLHQLTPAKLKKIFL